MGREAPDWVSEASDLGREAPDWVSEASAFTREVAGSDLLRTGRLVISADGAISAVGIVSAMPERIDPSRVRDGQDGQQPPSCIGPQ